MAETEKDTPEAFPEWPDNPGSAAFLNDPLDPHQPYNYEAPKKMEKPSWADDRIWPDNPRSAALLDPNLWEGIRY